MTKAKLHEEVLSLCNTHNASKKLTEALSELTKPKVGGSSDVNDYTAFNEDGSVAAIFCTYHKQWEPVSAVRTVDAVEADEEAGTEAVEAYEEDFNLFVEDTKSKNGFRRYCDAGDKQWKEAAKLFKTSKEAIVTDILDGEMSGADGKSALEKLQEARDIHTPRVDGLGEDNKPGDVGTEEA